MIKKMLWFTHDGNGFSIAKKLQEEGWEVLVGQTESYKELGIDKEEEPDDTEMRISTWDGMIEKMPTKQLLKKMEDFEDKNDWSVVCDFNNLYAISEKVRELGFAGEEGHGFYFLPTKEQYDLESDRDAGKNFVEQHYSIKVGEKHDFKTIDEGIQFLQEAVENDKIYVLKAYSDDLNAIVPTSEDPNLAKDELISALASERAGYESQGYLLEEKISNPQEITPQAVFYDGELVFCDIDIETKPLFAGDTGPQTGCASNLVLQINEFDPISEIAFPPKVFDMALEHKGMFIWDASILIDSRTGIKYFGEFCANRWGFDSFFTELAMCESVSSYFEMVKKGINPLVKRYGASVRMFNVKKAKDISVIHKNTKDIWMFDVKQVKDNVVSIGYCWDLLVATGTGNDIEEAVDECYERLSEVAFTGGGYKPKFDFLSEEYPTSIISRHNDNIELFNGERYEGTGIDERVRRMEKTIEKLNKDNKAKDTVIASADQNMEKMKQEIRDEILAALHEDEP